MKRSRSTFAAAALVIPMLLVPTLSSAAWLESAEDRRVLKELERKTLEGGDWQPDQLRGKVTIMTFWATWCSACKQELDTLTRLQREFGSKDIQVMGVNVDTDDLLKKARRVSKKHRWNINNIVDNDKLLRESITRQRGLPLTVIVDQNGRVAHTHVGFLAIEDEQYTSAFRTLLKE